MPTLPGVVNSCYIIPLLRQDNLASKNQYKRRNEKQEIIQSLYICNCVTYRLHNKSVMLNHDHSVDSEYEEFISLSVSSKTHANTINTGLKSNQKSRK